MCLPALGIIGGIVSGIGAMAQANAAAASHEAQAKFQERQAQIEVTTGAYKAKRQQEQVDRVLGSQRAQYAAGGVALSGTPSLVIEESAHEGALDVAAIRWNSRLAADNAMYQSKVDRMNAKSARASAPIAFLTPVLGSVARFDSSFG